jgi:hypothetical protein
LGAVRNPDRQDRGLGCCGRDYRFLKVTIRAWRLKRPPGFYLFSARLVQCERMDRGRTTLEMPGSTPWAHQSSDLFFGPRQSSCRRATRRPRRPAGPARTPARENLGSDDKGKPRTPLSNMKRWRWPRTSNRTTSGSLGRAVRQTRRCISTNNGSKSRSSFAGARASQRCPQVARVPTSIASSCPASVRTYSGPWGPSVRAIAPAKTSAWRRSERTVRDTRGMPRRMSLKRRLPHRISRTIKRVNRPPSTSCARAIEQNCPYPVMLAIYHRRPRPVWYEIWTRDKSFCHRSKLWLARLATATVCAALE